MFRFFKKKWLRVSSIATILAIAAILFSSISVPSTKLRLDVGGFLSFEANVGVSVAEAASITTLEGHSGFEFGDFTEWDGAIGSVAIQGTTKNTGDYAMRANPSASAAYVEGTADADYFMVRTTFFLYIATAPDSETIIVSEASANTLNVRLTTDRYLKLYNDATQKGSTGTTQLSTATWYRISVSVDMVTANDPAAVYINGNSEISADTDGVNAFTLGIGVRGSVSADLYFDDFAKDDTDSTADLGDVRVLRAMPNATGQYAQYDQTSGYTYVDDFPISDASYVEDNQATAVRESYNIESASDIGIGASDDIHALNVWIRGNADGGGGTDHMTMVRDSSSDYNSADHAFDGLAWFDWYTPDLPNGGGAWTVARFDAFQIGAYHNGAQDQRVMSVLAMVAFTPVSGVPDISNSPSSIAFGVILNGSDNWSNGSAPTFPLDDAECYFTVTNNGSGAVSITVKATNFTGGVGWTLASSPGADTVTMKAGKSGDATEGAMITLTTTEQAFISGLAASGTKKWEIKLEAPTSATDGAGKTSTVTLTATLD